MHKLIFAIRRLDKFGGAERVMISLANEFARNGVEVTILTFIGDSCVYRADKNVSVVFAEKLCGGKGVSKKIKMTAALRTFIKEIDPDAVIAFQFDLNVISVLASAGMRCPLIVSERNDPARTPGNRLFRLIRGLTYPFADGFVFQTEQAKSYFSQKIQRRAAVICNPLRDDLPESDRTRCEKTIVSTGRLVRQKNHGMLIESFSRIHNEFPEYRLIIYGEGPLRDELLEKAESLGVSDSVSLPGTFSDIDRRVSEASLFVLSSDYEGIPNVLMEAMAMGVPCISTDCPCGGPALLTGNGERGLLVPAGDTAAMSGAIRRVLSDVQLQNVLSNAGREIRKLFSMDKFLISGENILRKWQP